jgi:hypothetical protein
MTPDLVLDRLRAANPEPAAVLIDDELFAKIVSNRPDPRLAPSTRLRRGRRMGVRRLALIAAAVLLATAGGAVGAVKLGLVSASPKTLFEANPAAQFPGAVPEQVIPKTVHRATTFDIPGVGRFEWWIALSTRGWLCEAIRQPNGTWADVTEDEYQLGGPAPGCGRFPWHDRYGFAYDQSNVQSPNRRLWRVAYGYIPTTGGPVEVRDRISGATARIGDGRYFVIVMPVCKVTCDVTELSPHIRGYQLQTLYRAGHVIVTDAYDPGM